ncbi:MAG TPA: PQQ-dependent sugar dehydrogenase [Acidimicrobiia bacterium]|nr:PQQ-dependent sugar dehydrogenase [Acidimicrobiia bacterium]
MPPSRPLERRVGLLLGLLAVLFVVGLATRSLVEEGEIDTTTTKTVAATTSTAPGGTTSTTSGSSTTDTSIAPLGALSLQPVATGLGQPTYALAPAGSERIWVVERPGRITVLESDGSVTATFLDIQEQVAFDGIEQGMLGLAFHPEFPDDPRVFVYYVAEGVGRRLSEFTTVSEVEADPDSERILFEATQPPRSTDIRHYGGMVQFGPDGFLWISSGDGANASDQGQNSEGLFGKILRIDVDSGDPYGIPPDNPFVDGGGGQEVWAYGLRNPWRFSIDAEGGNIYIGDVGFGAREEINVLSLAEGGGSNLGWANVEGTVCFQEDPCDPADYVLPAVEYDHDDGCSVAGGQVYRGPAIPELHSVYFYSDWCQGWIRSFVWDGEAATDERDWTEELGGSPGQVNAFGLDGAGEILVVTHGGDILRLVANR